MEIFELQKLITAFATPLGFAILLALLGVALSRRWIVLVAMAWLWLWSMPWAAQRLAAVIESRTPLVAASSLPTADVIVVLGGGLSPAVPNFNPEINLGSGADRVLLAAKLYGLGKAPRVLFTGGPVDYFGNSEATSAAGLLETLGVPRAAQTLEPNSRTTRENVAFSLPLLQAMGAHRVLLVSSAAHLPRSLINFRQAAKAQGLAIEFIAAPCDPVEIFDNMHPVKRWLPNTEALNVSRMVFKELLGLAHAAVFKAD